MTRMERRKILSEEKHRVKMKKVKKHWVTVGMTTIVGLGVIGLSEGVEASADTWKPTSLEEMKTRVKLEDGKYTFQSGDTFWAIGNAINIKPEKLMELNNFPEGSQYSVPIGTTIYWNGDNVKVVDQAGNVIAQETIKPADKVNPNAPVGGNSVNTVPTTSGGNIKGNQNSSSNNSSNVKGEENTGSNNGGNGNNGGTTTPTPSNPEQPNPVDPNKPTEPEKPQQSELEKLKARLAELKQQLAVAKQELAQAEQELANAKSDTSKSELEAKINEQKTIIDSAQATITTKQAEVASIDSQISVANNELSTAQNNLATANTALSTAQSNTATAQQAFDAANTALLADPSDPILQQAVTDTQSALNNAQAQETLAVNEQASAQTAVNTAQSNVDTLNSSKTQASSELETAQSTLSTAQNEKSNLEQQLSNIGNTDIPALEAKVKERQKVVADLEAEIKEVEKKIAELEGKEKPTPPVVVDKSALSNLVNSVKATDLSKYTDDTVSAFENALANANSVLSNEKATQEQINSAVSNLQSAFNNLTEKIEENKVDKSALQNLVNSVKDTDLEPYTDDSVQKFNAALSTANSVLSNDKATQAQVDQAVSALQTAFDGLVEKPEVPKVDKSALQSAIDQVSSLKQADYTTASWTKLQTALTNAKQVLDNKDATQSQVDAQVTALNNAKSALVKKANKTALDQAIGKVPAQQGSYTDTSWKALQSALSTAKQVSSKEDATQTEVDSATTALNKAIGDLKVQKYTLTVIHKDQDGKVLDQEEFQVEKGKNYSAKAKGIDGYELVGESTKVVSNMQADGTVIFTYKKKQTQEEQVKETINTVNSSALDVWKEYRQENGKTATIDNEILQAMADQRAKELETLFEHTRPDGTTYDTIEEDFDYFETNSKYEVVRALSSENIARIQGVTLEWLNENGGEYIMNMWKNSGGHNANLLLDGTGKIKMNQASIGTHLVDRGDGTYDIYVVALIGYDTRL